MKTRDIIHDKLKEAGAVLIRNKKHEVWQLPNGMKVVLSHSTSDQNAEWGQLRDLRRAMRGGSGAS